LQKYDRDWNCFVNIDSLEDVSSGDRLTVAKFPTAKNSKAKKNQTGEDGAERTRSNHDNAMDDVSSI